MKSSLARARFELAPSGFQTADLFTELSNLSVQNVFRKRLYMITCHLAAWNQCYTTKTEQLVAMLIITGLNNILLPTLFMVVRNIVSPSR